MAAPSNYLMLDIPQPLASLLHACEVHCVAACCGTDAFDVSAVHMIPWIQQRGADAAQEAIAQLDFLITLAVNSLSRLCSDEYGLGTDWSSAECVAYLESWRAEILRALGPAVPPSG